MSHIGKEVEGFQLKTIKPFTDYIEEVSEQLRNDKIMPNDKPNGERSTSELETEVVVQTSICKTLKELNRPPMPAAFWTVVRVRLAAKQELERRQWKSE